MNGLLLAYADLLYNDQADADAAEQAFNSTHGPFLERITARHDRKPREHASTGHRGTGGLHSGCRCAPQHGLVEAWSADRCRRVAAVRRFPPPLSRTRILCRMGGRHQPGVAMAVVSGGWDEDASVYLLGHRLHTYVLWWTAPRAGTTQDSGTLRRVVLHCPGEETCRRGGCDTTLDDELVAAIGLVAIDAGVTASIAANADWAADAYRASSLGTIDDDPEEVLSVAAQPLLAAGWEEVSSSSSELGDVEVLLSHQDQVLTAAYSPLTREITFADGYQELDFLCEILAEDGGLVEDPEGARQVDRTAVSDTWSDSALSLIEKHLRHDLADNTTLINPLKVLVAGTWPWGTGVPGTDEDRSLVHRQVMLTLTPTPLLGK